MILLDTHVLYWFGAEPQRLSRRASMAIRRAQSGGGVGIASISLWELARMITRGVIRVHGTPEAWLSRLVDATGVVVKDLTPTVAVLASQLPVSFPGDPADRLIAGTARAEDLVLLTRDERIRSSPLLRTLW